MGVIVTPQVEIDKYFNSDALGQSSLKKLLSGIDSFLSNQEDSKELYYEEKSYFIVGSAVDTILTGEIGEFDKQFYVSALEKKPSDAEMSIINMIFDELVENNVEVNMTLDQYPNMVAIAIDEHGWQKNWKQETRVNKIVEKGAEYFEDLKKSYGKQIMTSEQKILIDNIVMSLTTNSRTAKYFDREAQSREQNVDFYYQLPIYFNYRDVNCKALMDLVVVVKDNEDKIISAQGFDLKTMSGNTLNFLGKVKGHRYDIQASWYNLALLSWLAGSSDSLVLKPFTFIVESTTMPGQPLVYELTEDLLSIGRNGRPAVQLIDTNLFADDRNVDVVISKEIRGYESLLDDFIYYEETEWKQDRVIAENPEKLILGWNGIV